MSRSTQTPEWTGEHGPESERAEVLAGRGYFDRYELSGPAEKVLRRIKKAIDAFPANRSSVRIETGLDSEYEPEMIISCYRLETEMEMGQRKARERNTKEAEEAKQRALYEQLMAKFG